MCPLSFWSHQLSSFFPLLPRLELHDSLRPLLVEDPVAALAAADDVPGLELVLVALMRFFSFGGDGARREVEVRKGRKTEGRKGTKKERRKGRERRRPAGENFFDGEKTLRRLRIFTGVHKQTNFSSPFLRLARV